MVWSHTHGYAIWSFGARWLGAEREANKEMVLPTSRLAITVLVILVTPASRCISSHLIICACFS